MTAFHFYCGALMRRFACDANAHGHVFYRFLNEAPTLLMMGIVIMVVVKPFAGD
ncbi:MAG: CopD family protein [Methylocystis sp.]|nr:CopD family protein [Methylocystis sp.]